MKSTEPAAGYLRCLLAVTRACAEDRTQAQLAQDVATAIADHCADMVAIAIYRVAHRGEHATLLASAGARSDAFATRVQRCESTAWPASADESSPGRLVMTMDATTGAAPSGWLHLHYEGVPSEARESFAALATQALAAALSRQAIRDAATTREDALLRRERAVSQFLDRMSNEIRTPVTLLLGPLEAALDRRPDAGLEVALRHAHRLRRLVDALLDLSHVDAGRLDPVLLPIDLAAMTRDLTSLFHGAATAAGIALAIDCPTLPQPVHVDRAQWEQVVINLIDNAIRFTPSGEVRVTLREQVGLVTLEVSDTGVGIDADELPHVFDRFHRVHGQDDGGLGLALVRELVRLHGGDIEATSTPGRGSQFRVCIPMLGQPARAASHRRVGDLPARPEPGRPEDMPGWVEPAATRDAAEADVDETAGRERIVLVVNHRELRDYIAGLLRPHYRVQAPTSAATALVAVEDSLPGMVVADFGGAPAQGLAFVRTLRASSHGAVVPVLLLSSDTRENAHAESMAAGADDVIVKPFFAAELLARVRARMQLSSDRRELHRRLTDHNLELETQVAARTAALAASEGQFRAISNLVPDILWRADAHGTTEWRSDQWQRFTGDAGHSEGWDFVHPDDREGTQAWLRETVAGRRLAPHEYRLRRHDGAYRRFTARMSPLRDEAGRVQHWFGSATDIERHQLARDALAAQVDEGSAALARSVDTQQALLHRLSRSQEDERRRIARELHDSLGQYLAALKLALSALGPAIVDPALRAMVLRLDRLTSAVDRELDDVIAALRPVVLDELGLAGALPALVADWSRQTGIAAEALLVQVDDERFDDESESTLYRATQESLTNVVKHAQARNVAVTLTRCHDELHLSVEDDGVGFDVTQQATGWGLRGMAERARGVGGLVQIESDARSGTTVLVRIPCRPRASAS